MRNGYGVQTPTILQSATNDRGFQPNCDIFQVFGNLPHLGRMITTCQRGRHYQELPCVNVIVTDCHPTEPTEILYVANHSTNQARMNHCVREELNK